MGPSSLVKELGLECGKNLSLRWHVFCLYFCFTSRVLYLPKKTLKPKVSEEEWTVGDLDMQKLLSGRHAQFTTDLVITALKNFVRTQVWVVWNVLSWLCIRNRNILTQANKSCFNVEQIV